MAFERGAYIEAVIGADITAFRRGMREVRNELGVLSEQSGGLSALGRTMTLALSAPLAVMGSVMAQSAISFEENMRNINSLLWRSEEQFQSLTQEVLTFGMTTRDGAISASAGLYELVSAGYEGADALSVFAVINKTAEAGLADMATTTRAVASTLLAYALTGEESAWRVSNSLTRAVQVGVGSMEAFANSLPETRATGNLLGINFEELDFSVARLTQLGFSASEAGTRVKNMVSKLGNPTEDIQKLYDTIGVAGGKELIARFGLIEGLIKLRELVTTEDEILGLFGEKRATEGFASLTNNINETRGAVKYFFSDLDNATMNAWTEQSKSFGFAFDLMTSAMQGASIVIGNEILPLFKPLVENLTSFFLSIAQANPNVVRFGVVLGGLAIALPPLIWLFGSLLSPIGLVIGAIGMLATAMTRDLGGLGTVVANIVGSMGGDLKLVADLFKIPESLITEAITPLEPMSFDLMAEDLLVITVKTDGTWWDTWNKQFKKTIPTWDDFKTVLAESNIDVNNPIQMGEIFDIKFDSTDMGDRLGQAVNDFNARRDGMMKDLQTTSSKVETVMLPFGIEVNKEAYDEVLLRIGGIRDAILEFVDKIGGNRLFSAVSGFFDALASLVGAINWDAVGVGLGSLAQGVLQVLSVFASASIESITKVIEAIVLFIEAVTTLDGAKLAQSMGKLVEALLSVFKGIIDGLAIMMLTLFKTIFSTLNPSFGGMFDEMIVGFDTEIARIQGLTLDPLDITVPLNITATAMTRQEAGELALGAMPAIELETLQRDYPYGEIPAVDVMSKKANPSFQNLNTSLQEIAQNAPYQGVMEMNTETGESYLRLAGAITITENAMDKYVGFMQDTPSFAERYISELRDIESQALMTAQALSSIPLSIGGSPGIGSGGNALPFETGIGYVPVDNMPAYLHKGERVLTASQNKQYNANNQTLGIPRMPPVSRPVTNNVTINQTADVEGLLRELKRRGINLDNKSLS